MSDHGKQYVYNGVLLRCDKGVIPTPFTVLPRPSLIRGQFQAHELDLAPLTNIKPFGVCAITRGPCLPAPLRWTQVHQGSLRLGPASARPLLESSVCRCGVGGSISIIMPPVLPAAPAAIATSTPAEAPAPPAEGPGDATAHEVAEGFKGAALGFAVLGVGLAIAGCFFPPLELAAGASFEAALAASAGTAFIAADVSMAVGIGLDVAVAQVHPTPANRAVVVGDVVGLAIGYGAGKALGALASKYGPAVAEAFAQRAGREASEDVTQKLTQEAAQVFRPATFDEFAGTVGEFRNGANQELAQKSYKLYQEQKWAELENLFNEHKLNEWNGIIWPPNRGFVGVSDITLGEEIGMGGKEVIIDRFGGRLDADGKFVDSGTFVAPADVKFSARALPESTKDGFKNTYRVLKPIPGVKSGQAIPWLGQPGMGIQYELPKGGIDALLEGGFIERIPNRPTVD